MVFVIRAMRIPPLDFVFGASVSKGSTQVAGHQLCSLAAAVGGLMSRRRSLKQSSWGLVEYMSQGVYLGLVTGTVSPKGGMI